MAITAQNPSTAEPQPKDYFHHEGTKVTKEDFSPKGAKGARCHFDSFDKTQDRLREKSFSDPSHSLGMTDRGPSLCELGSAKRFGLISLRLSLGARTRDE